jgi:hypothetical protein
MRHLTEPVYESLPAVYALGGALLLWLSYYFRQSWWSTPCALVGLLGLIAGLMVWMRRREYRASGEDYVNRGRPAGESADEPP